MSNEIEQHLVESPLVPAGGTRLVREIPSHRIVDGYKKQYDIDVSDYFAGIPTVQIYECVTSGYRFYFPFLLIGKEGLYAQLQQFDWNYKQTKWEYQWALQFVNHGSKLLDVGCGVGAFLELASNAGASGVGLELNQSAVAVARRKELNVLNELLSTHVRESAQTYDIVCSFQVLEHIADVHVFIRECVDALKSGGILIFGVPNNDGFLAHADNAVLNFPPHHMGLWSHDSLCALSTIFPLRLLRVETEPLMEIDWYTHVLEQRFLPAGVFRSAYYKLKISNVVKRIVKSRAHKIRGHTIVAAYRRD